jgi:hypothetical protein
MALSDGLRTLGKVRLEIEIAYRAASTVHCLGTVSLRQREVYYLV